MASRSTTPGTSSGSGSSSSPGPGPAAERARILDALEAGLEQLRPGIEILDRDLALDERARADLAALDSGGRLVLVILADGDGDRAVLDALDTLAFVRGNAQLVVSHLRRRELRSDLEPQLLVVAETPDPALAARLGALVASGIELLEVRTIKSSGTGQSAHLVPVGPLGVGGEGSLANPAAVFLDSLPSGLREVGGLLLGRMARADVELSPQATRSSIVWRFRGEVLARVDRQGNVLLGSVGLDQAPLPLRGAPDVEGLVDGALERVLAISAGDGESEGGQRALGDDEPLLSQEELDAFRPN